MPDKSLTIFEHISSKVAPAEAVMFLTFIGFCILGVAAFVYWMIPDNFRNKWWYFATGIVTLFATILLVLLDIERLDQLGGFLAGVFSPLAILWFVAAYRQQSEELSMQREELKLQREAIEQQTKEWKDMKQYSAMEKAEQIMKQFEIELKIISDDGLKLHRLKDQLEQELHDCEEKEKESDKYYYSSYEPYHELELTLRTVNTFFQRFITAVTLYEKAIGKKILGFAAFPEDKIALMSPGPIIPTIALHSEIARELAILLQDKQSTIARYEYRSLSRRENLSGDEITRLQELAEIFAEGPSSPDERHVDPAAQ